MFVLNTKDMSSHVFIRFPTEYEKRNFNVVLTLKKHKGFKLYVVLHVAFISLILNTTGKLNIKLMLPKSFVRNTDFVFSYIVSFDFQDYFHFRRRTHGTILESKMGTKLHQEKEIG